MPLAGLCVCCVNGVPFNACTATNLRRAIYVGPVTMLRDCLNAFAASGVHPVIDRAFGFGDAPAALGYLRSGGHLGKIVIER
jgi:NADPH:quinone reductase-like Zn-dependent oxidoreductase